MDSVAIIKDAKNVENAKLFMNFTMDPENAAMISEFAKYSNGIKGSEKFMSEELRNAPELSVPDEFKSAGSFPEKITQANTEIFVNRSYVFHPNGLSDFQDKHIMTRFETESWDIHPGTSIKVIDTAIGTIGISICYDSEFPLIAHRQIEMGADLILVPSVTETLAGYHRVRTGSQARAMENQCYVLHAPLVGEAAWSTAIDISIGCAGVYTPMDEGFPADGILVQGEMNQSAWVYATLDFAKMRALRTNGNVLNHRDWDAQLQLL